MDNLQATQKENRIMGRNKTTPEKNGTGFDDEESIREELKSLGADGSGATVSGRIYRRLPPDNERGIAQPTEFCGPVDRFVDEDYVGKKFGPGHYKIRFIIKYSNGVQETRDKLYDIGSEYARFAKPETPAPTQVQGPTQNAPQVTPAGLLGTITSIGPEKLAAWAMAFKTIKEIFAPPPPPPPPDYLKLFELMNANRSPNISESVVIKAMENIQAQQRAASPLQQLKELRELKAMIKDDEPENQNEGEMDTIIKMAMEYLPTLLNKNGGNYQAAGQQAAEFPMVKNLIRNDPGLAQKFFETAVKQYGQQNALQLAAGFGFQPVTIPQNQQAINNQEEAGEIDDLPDEGD